MGETSRVVVVVVLLALSAILVGWVVLRKLSASATNHVETNVRDMEAKASSSSSTITISSNPAGQSREDALRESVY